MSDLAQNLKKLRHNRRLTQKQVAESIGISQGNYSAIESGKVEPSLSTLTALADFFNETLDTLTDFIRIIYEDEPLTIEEEEWLELFREMDAKERSMSLGILHAIKEQRENPYKYLPKDMDSVDFLEEMKQKESDLAENE